MQTSVRRSASTPEALFEGNQRLVGHVLASRFSHLPEQDREESECWGRLGLWSAARKFDPALGFQFSSYAVTTIYRHILNSLTQGQGKNPPFCVSLDAPLSGAERKAALGDTLPGESGVDALLEQAEVSARLSALLSPLPPRRRELLLRLYGEEHTLQEIADDWGVTRQAAGTMHLRSLRQLREAYMDREVRAE